MDLVAMKWLLSGLVLPPAGPLLLALLGMALLRRERRRAGQREGRRVPAGATATPCAEAACPDGVAGTDGRLGRRLVIAGLVAAWVSGLSPVGGALMLGIEAGEVALSQDRLTAELASADPPGAIVVLAGGMSYNPSERPDVERPNDWSLARLAHGAWLARASGLPLLLSGGRPPNRELAEARVMARVLERSFGLAPRWVEERSRDTADNASESAKLLREAGIRRVVLVTQAYHMRRAAAAFEAAGVRVLRAPHDFAGGVRIDGPGSFVPSASGTRGTWLALHEGLGLVWYRLRGHL